VQFLLEHACAGLFLDPGLRKTSITLGALKILKDEGMLGRVLIIAPLRVCVSVWPEEIKKWTDFHGLTYQVLHGPKKDRQLAESKADILIINPEGLEWLLKVKTEKIGNKKVITADVKAFKKLGLSILVVDEISKFKHYDSNRSQALRLVLNLFDRRWGLTGSPAPNGLIDLFNLMYIIDSGRALGQFITHYRTNYFRPTGYGGYTWVPQKGAEEAIYARIAPTVFRLSAEDHIHLPNLVENVIKVELPANVRKIYDELEDEFITEFNGNTITAMNAGVASGKCRQIANGGLYHAQLVDEEGRKSAARTWDDLHEAKLDAVEDLIDELNGAPVIVTYDFAHDLVRLQKRFGKKNKPLPVIGGGISPTKSDAIVKQWNAGSIPILLGHPMAMAHGLNMQEGNAQHVILHSLTYDYELYDQLLRRLRRSGNKSAKVFAHLIVAKQTVDEAIVSALRKKKKTQTSLFDALREYSKQRLLQRSKISRSAS